MANDSQCCGPTVKDYYVYGLIGSPEVEPSSKYHRPFTAH